MPMAALSCRCCPLRDRSAASADVPVMQRGEYGPRPGFGERFSRTRRFARYCCMYASPGRGIVPVGMEHGPRRAQTTNPLISRAFLASTRRFGCLAHGVQATTPLYRRNNWPIANRAAPFSGVPVPEVAVGHIAFRGTVPHHRSAISDDRHDSGRWRVNEAPGFSVTTSAWNTSVVRSVSCWSFHTARIELTAPADVR